MAQWGFRLVIPSPVASNLKITMPKRLLIKNLGHLVTMNPQREVLTGAWIVAEDGKIKSIGKGRLPRVAGAEVVDGRGGIATPGLSNTHHHLLQNRRNSVKQKPSLGEKIAFNLFAFGASRPTLWKFGMELGRLFQPLQNLLSRTPLDPVKPWTQSRELPQLADETFKDWWRNRK